MWQQQTVLARDGAAFPKLGLLESQAAPGRSAHSPGTAEKRDSFSGGATNLSCSRRPLAVRQC